MTVFAGGEQFMTTATARSSRSKLVLVLALLLSHAAAALAQVSFGRNDFSAGTQPGAVAIADFNGDRKLDIAVADFGGSVAILLSNGDGTFQPATFIADPYQPTAVAAGDFNGDGRVDLAVANFANNTVSVFLGNGDGVSTWRSDGD